ncbi:DUF2637 domain-containing protein [Nonomuraea sp. NPDC049486]|uniref:DUF2637 domain-containing protein n=1 Tax=Nonomuraea sp. NPDC049486 TaxID=3155773 RepID=UPI00342A47F4
MHDVKAVPQDALPLPEMSGPGRLRRIARALTPRFRLQRRPARPRRVPAAPIPARPVADPGGGRLIRGSAVIVLLGVAAAAAYVSYHHFYALALQLGERHDMAILYPAMSDGVIVMASLVMVYCSRRGLPVPFLAWAALALGGAVTLAANVAHGWDGGTGSRLLSALAPVAFVGAYELLMWLIRSGQNHAEAAPVEPVEKIVYRDREVQVEVVREVRVLPKDRFEAAAWDYEDSLQPGGRKAGRRALANRWGISEREAVEIQEEVDGQQAAPPPSLAIAPAALVPSVNGAPVAGTGVAP